MWIRDEAVLIRDEEGLGRFWQGVMIDVTDRKQAEEQIRFLAYHDRLTGLPNRTMFEEALGLAGADNLRGKIVIDTTNPISDQAPVDGVLQFFTGPNSSLLERLQAAYPQARFVKAFNSVGSARMVNPLYRQGKPTMFHCGNDAEAKASVSEILKQFGWEPADMGTAAAARAIEPLCQLWCIPGLRQNNWTHAFAVLWS